MSGADELRALLRERTRRRLIGDGGEPLDQQRALYRGYLIAAFGEADVAAAEAINATKTDDDRPLSLVTAIIALNREMRVF